MQILGPLGMYLDTVVVEVKMNLLFFRLALAILCYLVLVLLHLGIMTLGYKRCNKCLLCYISCMRYSRSHS